MNKRTEYTKKVMDDLDALLADLQATTAHSSYNNQGPPPPRPANQTGSEPKHTIDPGPVRNAHSTENHARLPPQSAQELPDTIPPPQQFGDQPLYEPQQVKRNSSHRVSSSSHSSQSSGDVPYNTRDIPPATQPSSGQPGMSVISNNLSELDQLLADLNSAQFMAEVDKKHAQNNKQAPPPVAPKPGRGGPGGPGGGGSTVDSLLDQLESSVPAPAPQDAGYHGESNQVHYQTGEQTIAPPPQPSSAATQELDTLMASLSDFKMKDKQGPSIQAQVAPMRRSPSPGSEPSYAKPQKSRNLSQSSTNSSMQSSNMTGNLSSNSTQGGQLESMLGDLQSDLSRQGVNTKTKGLCAACNQPVMGQVITALGKIWHIEHFNCAHCHEALGTKNFYERDGMAYCERDYHSLFAPKCSYCNGPIVDKCVTALNQTWHPEHFFCAQCGRPFGDDGFHEKDGKAYCKADFFEMFAPKCGGCGRAIVNNYISGLNRHWHPECFACWECHQPFGGGSFFDYEGLPYCETHYHQKRGSLCAGCQKPISGRCITAMYKKFHPEHFVCAFCLKQLNKGTFKEQNDRPYCHPCFVKLFG